jgi:hypothetical protein
VTDAGVWTQPQGVTRRTNATGLSITEEIEFDSMRWPIELFFNVQ